MSAPIPHGTAGGYTNNGCRCRRCSAAQSRYYYGRKEAGALGYCADCGAVKSAVEATRCRVCHHIAQAVSVRPSSLRCSSCRRWKPDSEYAASAHPSRRGRHHECKPCDAARKRRYRAEHRDEYNARARARRAEK